MSNRFVGSLYRMRPLGHALSFLFVFGTFGCGRSDKLSQGKPTHVALTGVEQMNFYIETTYSYPFDVETRQSLSVDDLKRVGGKREIKGAHAVLSGIPSMVVRGQKATAAEITNLDLRFGMIYRGPGGEMQDLWIDRSCKYGISNGHIVNVDERVGEFIRNYCQTK